MNVKAATATHTPRTACPSRAAIGRSLGIWLALTMAVLDGAIANVALPVIARELGASPATSVWVINAYQLTITVLLLPLAALGDRIGYKCIYIPGLALFTLGSVGCALGGTLTLLIAARVFQGMGAACIMSMNAALVRATYPAKHARPRHRLQCDGAVGVGRGRADARRADPQRRVMAVAVPDQPADRHRRADRRAEVASRPARAWPAVRLAVGAAERRMMGWSCSAAKRSRAKAPASASR